MTLVETKTGQNQNKQKINEIKNIGIPKEIYDKMKIMPYEELNIFLAKGICKYYIEDKQTSGCKSFVRIPRELNNVIENDIDKYIYILTIHLFNYSKLHKLIRLNPIKFCDLFWLNEEDYDIEEMPRKLCGKYDFIKIEYHKPDLVVTYNEDKIDTTTSKKTKKKEVQEEVKEKQPIITPTKVNNKDGEIVIVESGKITKSKILQELEKIRSHYYGIYQLKFKEFTECEILDYLIEQLSDDNCKLPF